MDQCIINFGGFNWLSVFVAALAGFALGALWYSPLLFSKPWMKLQDLQEENLKEGWMKAMIVTFITTLLTAFVLEAVIATWHLTFWGHAFPISIMFGLFLYAGNQLSDFMYSRRPMKLFWITSMYRFVMILIMSIILILWQ